jgi:Outer membrane protein beta-barrel domain
MMIKKLAVFSICLLAFSLSVQAQESSSSSSKKHAMPNIPGAFVLELGLNQALNRPDKFELGLWGSRALNIYYQYDMRILKSKFSFHPGVGFGLERYKFKNNNVLRFDNNHELLMDVPTDILGVRKSQLITNYFDVPLELRFSTNPEDPTRSFKISVGARVGYLFESFTKVKYDDNGDKAKRKEKEAFNLNPFRYGVYMKIGGGNFSLFGYYNLSPLFKKGQGPTSPTSTTITEMNNFTVGISLSSF